jgi:Na+/proline symporter
VRAEHFLSFTPTKDEIILPFVMIIGLQWLFQMNSDGTGYLAQRSMACKTDRQARLAAVVFTWAQILVRSLIWLVIGVGLLALYPFPPEAVSGDQFTASREILFVTGINEHLPAGARGIMLVGLLAALASTVDTHLNWGASYWSNDIYQGLVCRKWFKREPGRRELVIAARLSNLLILTIAIIIMANLGSIQTAWYLSLLFGAGMGSVLVLRWLWERINLYSELAAIVTSLVVAPILLVTTQQEWIRLSLMAVASTTAAVAVTFFTPSTSDTVLKEFYHRVKPSGWWRRAASLIGEDPGIPKRRLARGLRTTVLTALSLFLALVGIGKILVPDPGQSSLLPYLSLVAAVALIPFWWRDAVGKDDPSAEQALD